MSCFEPRPVAWEYTPTPQQEEDEPIVVAPVTEVVLRKIVRNEERLYIDRARAIIGELTGEDFEIAEPEWLCVGGIRLQSDGLCDRLKMMIDYAPCRFYALPKEAEQLYVQPELYDELLQIIYQTRVIAASLAGYAICSIPGGLSDADLRYHIRCWQHALTGFRVWVGSPRRRVALSPLCVL